MLIGKPGAARAAIAAALERSGPSSSLAQDLMGRAPSLMFLLGDGCVPTEEQRFFLDPQPGCARRAWAHAVGPGATSTTTPIRRADRAHRRRRAWLRHGDPGRGRPRRRVIEDVWLVLMATARWMSRPSTSRANIANSASRFPGMAIRCINPLDPRAERMIDLARERGIAGALGQGGVRQSGAEESLGQAVADERVNDHRGDVATSGFRPASFAPRRSCSQRRSRRPLH